MPRELHPHYQVVRALFSETDAAVRLLRPNLPKWLSSTLNWTTLTLQEGSYVDEALQASYCDLLFEVQWQAGAGQADAGAARDAPKAVLLYLVLEHRPKPDPWMSFRLLQYCIRIWDEVLRADDRPPQLPPVVPMVFCHGREGWRHRQEFADLFAEAAREWPCTPRFQHLLVDEPQEGAPLHPEVAMRLAELAQSGRMEELRTILKQVMTRPDEEVAGEFGKASGQHVSREKMYADELIEEGLQTGRQEGRLGAIEGFLRAGVGWPVIEKATGIDEETYQTLRQQLEGSDRTTG